MGNSASFWWITCECYYLGNGRRLSCSHICIRALKCSRDAVNRTRQCLQHLLPCGDFFTQLPCEIPRLTCEKMFKLSSKCSGAFTACVRVCVLRRAAVSSSFLLTCMLLSTVVDTFRYIVIYSFLLYTTCGNSKCRKNPDQIVCIFSSESLFVMCDNSFGVVEGLPNLIIVYGLSVQFVFGYLCDCFTETCKSSYM